jgi:competence protein ComEA
MRAHPAETVVIGTALCLAAALAQAAPASPKPMTAASAPQAEKRTPQAVDVNSAGRAELKKLPGIGDAEADRIIAGRPYLSKAHLQTHNVLSPMQYQAVRELVVAKQKDAKFLKSASQ